MPTHPGTSAGGWLSPRPQSKWRQSPCPQVSHVPRPSEPDWGPGSTHLEMRAEACEDLSFWLSETQKGRCPQRVRDRATMQDLAPPGATPGLGRRAPCH
jgi:hypothetical protein